MVEPKRSALLTALALALAAHAQLPLGYDNIIMFNCPGMATGCRLLGYHPLTTVETAAGGQTLLFPKAPPWGGPWIGL